MVTPKSSKMHVRKLITYTAREKFQPNVMEKSILKHLTTILESSCNNEGSRLSTYSLLYSSVRILAITRPISCQSLLSFFSI